MRQNKKPAGFIRRLVALGAAIIVLFAGFVLRLYQLQVVDGAYYYAQAVQSVTYTFDMPAARGEIVDRYGRVVAGNTAVSSVVLNKLFLPDSQLNDTLLALVEAFAASSEEWNDSTPLSDAAPYAFTAEEDTAEVKAMKDAFGKQQYATAQQVAEAAIQRYGLEEYTPRQQRILLGIRYEMERLGYNSANPFTLAGDVGERTVAVIQENSLGVSGVEVHQTTKRVYPNGTALPHALGIVGLISDAEWTADNHALREAGYAMDETIGKFGLEQAFESTLRGTSGTMEVERTFDGQLIRQEVTEAPQPGETVVLTIDLEFQLELQQLLEDYIYTLQDRAGTENASGGSVVVLDAKNGGVLAYANYPTYDINDYYAEYANLVSAEGNPMYNRAFQELYRPGSSFKPVVALTGLMDGEITPTSTVSCGGTYTYYAPGYTPGCLGVHGNTNVLNSLQHSCNIFFYDVGRRVGEERYNQTAVALGLGTETGLEVTELAGTLTSPETSALMGEDWNPANVVQGAIGQLDTKVTPVQLATYANTLANNGTRYRTHLVSGLRDHNTGAQTTVFDAEVVSRLDDEEAFATVRQGMRQATEGSNYAQHLGEAATGIPIATKTGSPQVTTDTTNGVIIAYGPAEDTDIAVAIVVENGANGYRLAELMAQIFASYNSLRTGSLSADRAGELLR